MLNNFVINITKQRNTAIDLFPHMPSLNFNSWRPLEKVNCELNKYFINQNVHLPWTGDQNK